MHTSVHEFQSTATEILSSIRPSATFLTIHKYLNNFGELSDYSICFHVDYLHAVKRSHALLEKYQPSLYEVAKRPFSINHLDLAKQELLLSFSQTLSGHNPNYTGKNAYAQVSYDHHQIPGLKYHISQDTIHLWGFIVFKRTILPGTYPTDQRKPLTQAKEYLRKLTPVGKFRQFKLQQHKFHKLVVENFSLSELDFVRKSLNSLREVG